MKTTIPLLIVGLHLAALAPSSQGYSYDSYDKTIIKANGETLHMRADSDNFTSGGSRRDALSEAINRWNNNPSDFQFTLSYESTTGFGNGQCEIWFSGSEYWLGAGDSSDPAPAICYNWAIYAGLGVWNLFEADILVYDDQTWETSDKLVDSLAYDYGNDNYRSLQNVFLHELGHALGLNHEDRNGYYNIMGQDWDFINASYPDAVPDHGEVHFYPGEDACNGAIAMYGKDSSAQREDVSVTHWKYSGASGSGYSVHNRCRVFKADAAETEVSVESGTDDATGPDTYGDPIFEVSKGHTIRVQLTFENSGYTYEVSPHVSYYLSADPNFDFEPTDKLLATRRPTLNRNKPYTFKQEMELPSNLTSGDLYYILVFVDDQYEISEVNPNNNKTYVRIRIK